MKLKASTGGTRQTQKARKGTGKRTRIGLIIFGVVVATVVGTLALSRSTSQASSAQQGQRKKYIATKDVIVDQTTGQRRKPTAEEIEILVAQVSALTNRSTEGLTVTRRPDGSEMVNLQNRFGNVALARANDDGSIEVRCVTSMEEAADFLGLEAVAQDQ